MGTEDVDDVSGGDGEEILAEQDVYIYAVDATKMASAMGEGTLSFSPTETRLGNAGLWHWMGTARLPLKPADEDYEQEGVRLGNGPGDQTWLLESRMTEACRGAFEALHPDGDYPDVVVGGKTLRYDPNPDAIGDSYHMVWIRLVSSQSSWEATVPGGTTSNGKPIDRRSYHLDGYIVDHSTRASVQYVMVPGTVPSSDPSSIPDGFMPDMDGIYTLSHSNLLPNRNTLLDVDADVPHHVVHLDNVVDPYPNEKMWFLDPECTQPFDFGSTPVTQANLVLYAPLVTNLSELPKTGGTGTAVYVVAGTILVALAGGGCIWYAVRRKKDEGRPESDV